MKNFLIILFLSIASLLDAQISVSETVIDYGNITEDTDLEKEIFFVNTGDKQAILLTNDFPREYSAHVSSKNVAPGDTLFLRWKFNAFFEGKFSNKITLWFSSMDRPIEIKIKGDVNYIDKYANPACPNFNERPAGQERAFDTDFLVIEEGSSKPIHKASIKVVDSGLVMNDLITNRDGEHKTRLPIRYYYFLVEAEGYEPVDFYSYVNSRNHRFVFEMKPVTEPAVVEEELVLEKEEEEVEEEKTPDPVIVIEPEEEETVEAEPIDNSPLEEFDSRIYAPNNIVFLVDVSGSMNSAGRLEILKSSMINMVNMMRPEDRISLVSYSRNANVLLEPTSGADKEEIIKQIRALKAQGATSGEKGLKRAYAVARSAFIKNGNNRVYIATDGVFKSSETKAINKLVKKNTRRKIFLSVLGIKGTNYTKKQMAQLAAQGKGDFVEMEDFDESAEDLKKLVKEQSKK